MEVAAVPDTEPSPDQFLNKRGKSRSWPPRERGIVYDPLKQSLEIRRVKKIEKERSNADSDVKYIRCKLPSSNIINVFVKTSTDGDVVTQGSGEDGDIFIGRLNLEKLSLKDQFSRFVGQLGTLYIVKSNITQSDERP